MVMLRQFYRKEVQVPEHTNYSTFPRKYAPSASKSPAQWMTPPSHELQAPLTPVSLTSSPAGYCLPWPLSPKRLSVFFSLSSSNSDPQNLSQTHHLTLGVSHYPSGSEFIPLYIRGLAGDLPKSFSLLKSGFQWRFRTSVYRPLLFHSSEYGLWCGSVLRGAD